ncbi:MAG: carbohydrate-binding domain-containing protein [Lachnospiraceae bacterium]|nr:carbohydrate-binding domain-containing protein [Lachnospiraceae bacterium]
MSTHKKIDIICVSATILMIVLTILFMNGRNFGVTPIVSAEADGGLFSANDLNEDWNPSSATKIILSDKGSTITGSGAYVYHGDVYIVSAGDYVLTGELIDGSVIIDADKNDKIWILLDGVTIHCDDDAAIRIEQADKVFLTLAEGTESTISAGAQYRADSIASGVDGVIYSRDDLTINGTGALLVNAAYQHGIVCNDDLVIAGGNITINAVQDGIHANDSVRIREAAISISAGDDGITVSNDDETAFLYVESGSITISDCYEGLEAINVTIAGGTIEIMPTDDGINASGSGENAVIRITGGEITIINDRGRDADGLDSNGDIYIEGGRVFISVSDSGGNCALDYGSENGGECVVSGGTVIACGGSMMAEGFDASSPQGFLVYSKNADAGTIISLEDADGRELLSEAIPCSFSHMVLSTPDLKVGDICTVVIDGVKEQITVDHTSSSAFQSHGMFGGGRRQGDFSRGNGQQFSDGQGMETFGGQDVEPPGGQNMEFPNGQNMEPSGGQGMEPPDRNAIPDGESREDNREMTEAGGKPFVPDVEPGNEMRASWQEQGRTEPGSDRSSPGVTVETFVLLGISVLVLSGGLVIAIKVKH